MTPGAVPPAGLPPAPPGPSSPPPAAARANWLLLIAITAIDLVIAPFYLLMSVFSAYAMMGREGPSVGGLVVLGMAAASLICPVLAWILQFAGGGRARIVVLALVPLAAPVVASLATGLTAPSGLIITPAK